MTGAAALGAAQRERIVREAAQLVRRVRSADAPNVMERFLAEYGLSTREGIALMCLAEALLRVPDTETIDALISDKIAPADWGAHLGRSSSPLVNASTWALLLTGRVVGEDEDGLAGVLHRLVRRLGEPIVRTAVGEAIREMGKRFVIGRTIGEALERAADREAGGTTHSYDMLGEAARTARDAQRYFDAYKAAIFAIAANCRGAVRDNPGISIKLSALHPRYEYAKRATVLDALVERVGTLARAARAANMGFNIDAEEADRLEFSLDVIEAVLADPALTGWDGFGVVVQAYGTRAGPVLDWLHALAAVLDRRIMVRLVKGAYWDSEVKRAQVLGLARYPVFTRKLATDVSYIACARRLFGMADRIYPQFATHNAHTVAAVRDLSGGDASRYEFQRLYGMGEALHDAVSSAPGQRCRIYAPVGAHRDLLAYLVRRLLENGANSSFVHQIVDESIAPEAIAADPFDALERLAGAVANPAVPLPADLYGNVRRNALGWDLSDPDTLQRIDAARAAFRRRQWVARPLIAGVAKPAQAATRVNPADPGDAVGNVCDASVADIEAALDYAVRGAVMWAARPVAERAALLERAADACEAAAPEFFALLAREAGKTLADAVSEVREAVDFLRYYAAEARRLGAQPPRGVFVCISPWNFPLAIFTGQIAAALVTGNAVIAKPAEQTPLIAARAVALLHDTGIPRNALQLLAGDGPQVGAVLVADPRVAGVCFTGSTEVAQQIHRAMAGHLAPDAPLIAETGGINAMLIDSSALPEQAVRDVLASAFQSAGQRCSALRMLYLQRDIETQFLEMLCGALDELETGEPWLLSTDIGPLIDREAQGAVTAWCERCERTGTLVRRLQAPASGSFVAPAIVRVSGIADIEREIFGPVLHVATFEADAIDRVVDDINARGFGLTFGLHTRVDARVQKIVERLRVGNLYVNRNQIGAVVGSQPFGGEGLSGTGPKAGGPHTLRRFVKPQQGSGLPADRNNPPDPLDADTLARAFAALDATAWSARNDRVDCLRGALNAANAHRAVHEALEASAALAVDAQELPGPTGESNRLRLAAREPVLCLGPGAAAALAQAVQALALGGSALVIASDIIEAITALRARGVPVAAIAGTVEATALTTLSPLGAVSYAATNDIARAYRRALAARDGAIIPLITEPVAPERYAIERHLCIDTTAAGGNATLMAQA